MITQGRLKEVIHYDKDTGRMVWKVDMKGGCKAGDTAGHMKKEGYLGVQIDQKHYRVHRLVWLYTYGYFPDNLIDHINRVTWDNRLCNLREVSSVCNMRNRKVGKNNTSGIKGVCKYNKGKRKWQAYIKVNREPKHLGTYRCFTNAVCARLAGEQCLDWKGCEDSSPARIYVDTYLKGE